METILIGADAWGLELKNIIKEHLKEKGYEVVDIGMYNLTEPIEYYKIGSVAAKKIQKGEVKRGILFCGTGMGVAIVANKFKGIYASVVESEFTAKMCKAVNDANILTMGGMIISSYKAKMAVDLWLSTEHTEGFDTKMTKYLKNALNEIKNFEEEEFRNINL